jgi:hypothetical protein
LEERFAAAATAILEREFPVPSRAAREWAEEERRRHHLREQVTEPPLPRRAEPEPSTGRRASRNHYPRAPHRDFSTDALASAMWGP